MPNNRNITNGHPSRAVFLPLNQNNSSPAKRMLPNGINETQTQQLQKGKRLKMQRNMQTVNFDAIFHLNSCSLTKGQWQTVV